MRDRPPLSAGNQLAILTGELDGTQASPLGTDSSANREERGAGKTLADSLFLLEIIMIDSNIFKYFKTGVLFVTFLFVAPVALAGASASFQGLGDLPGGQFRSRANAVSADGTVVVGQGNTAASREVFRWTSDGGMVGLGTLPGGPPRTMARGVSADGNVIVGYGDTASGFEAFRWTPGGGMAGMGYLPGGSGYSAAEGVSADGSVVVGRSNIASGGEAFRWTAGDGMVGLGELPGGSSFSEANAVSSDGSKVVGASGSTLGTEAFMWSSSEGMIGLGDLPGGIFRSSARAMSSDGSVVIGTSESNIGSEAFRWTEDGGMVGLGDLPGGVFGSVANDVSADGSVVVGMSIFNGAFIWDAVNGMRPLQDVLENDYGIDLTGWELAGANGISADGLTIVGHGYHTFDVGGTKTEGWIVNLPEPALLPLLCLSGFLMTRKRHGMRR